MIFSLFIKGTSQVQQSLEKILYIWAIKHPASGYVQGMNDLATPLYLGKYNEKRYFEQHFFFSCF